MVVRPDWSDDACRWGSEQLKRKTIAYAKEAGWRTTDLYGVHACRNEIVSTILVSNFSEILGHGNQDTYTANRLEKVFWRGDEVTEEVCRQSGLRGANFLSCQVGLRLVPYMIENGFRAITAYVDDFVFCIDRTRFPNTYAEPFFASHCTVDKSVFEGKSMENAHMDRLNRWQDEIRNANPTIKQYLVHDYNCDELFGDGKFVPANPQEPQPETKRYKMKGNLLRTSSYWDFILSGKLDVEGEVELEDILE